MKQVNQISNVQGVKKYMPAHSTHLNQKKRFDRTYKSTKCNLPENFKFSGNIPFNKTQATNIIKNGIRKNIFVGFLKNIRSRRLIFHVERRAWDSDEKTVLDPFRAAVL